MKLIPTFCVITRDNIKVPFWKLIYEHTDCGDTYKVKDEYGEYFDLKPCYWDMENNKVVFGIVKDHYIKETEYKIGENVVVEVDYIVNHIHNQVKDSRIVDIVYRKFTTSIKKVSNMETYELEWYFTPEEIKELKLEDIYEIKMWEPSYVLEDGQVVDYKYKLKHKIS